jgi:hypothetical protein
MEYKKRSKFNRKFKIQLITASSMNCVINLPFSQVILINLFETPNSLLFFTLQLTTDKLWLLSEAILKSTLIVNGVQNSVLSQFSKKYQCFF